MLLMMALLGLLAVGPVVALVALYRIRKAELRLARLDVLERDVSQMRAQLARVVAAAARPAPDLAGVPGRESAAAASPATPRPEPPRTPSAAPSAPTSPPPAVAPPPPPRPGIDWERWLGIRGASALGAAVLGFAGLLFFQYSIERGLITPVMRVIFGTLTGLGCLVVGEVARLRKYPYLSAALSGAGVVILYAAFWAAHVRYALIGQLPAFLLMVLVTACCCLIAVRSASLFVAVLGLVGGFVTPLLLSSGSDRPIGLFGYVLLLDLGLLAVGHKRRWPSLGVLSLLGTVLLQALWIGGRMGPERLLLGLVILVVFAALFVLAGQLAPPPTRRVSRFSQAGAILFPFAFALYFAGRVELGPHLYPIAMLLALLGAAACWLAREQRAGTLSLGAATASVAVVGVWLLQHRLTTALAWEVVAVAAALGLVYHVFGERDRATPGLAGPAPAAALAAGGLFALLVIAAAGAVAVPLWPWLAGWAALSALLYRQAEFPEQGLLQVGAALGLGLGLSAWYVAHHPHAVFPGSAAWCGVLVASSIALQAIALLRRDANVRRHASHAAATLPVVLLVCLVGSPFTSASGPVMALGACSLLGLLAAMAAVSLRSGRWYAGSVAAVALAQAAWVGSRPALAADPALALRSLLLLGLSVTVFTAAPFLAARAFSAERLAWYAAALAGPAWFLPLKATFEYAGGESFIGVLPLALGALALGALARSRGVWPADTPLRLGAIVAFATVALGFVSVAIPLQLEREWITIGWALEGVAVIALWRRLDHAGLKYLGLLLLGAVTVRLVLNPALLGYYPRSAVRVFNWLLYTYAVPVAALFGAAALLAPLEVERLRARERQFYGRALPLVSITLSVAAIAVTFVWINLSIADWFSTGTRLTLSFGATPAQRLTVSIAWAIYALTLLGIGIARDSLGLRWISLGFLLITIGKVFLYDLGALRDLYRVAALAGLAISLLTVSFLYQRFVFRKERAEGS